jgi:biopolymer transport protein ExbD
MPYKRLPDEPSEIVLPIPSFLDMAFQILAFFIVTFNPATMEGQLEMAMPASGEAKAQDPSKEDPTVPSETELDLKSDWTVTVETFKSGEVGKISGLRIEGLDNVQEPVPGDPNADPELEYLRRFLAKKRESGSNKDGIKIRAAANLKYLYVAKVMDACRKAGFKSVGFAPPPPEGPG